MKTKGTTTGSLIKYFGLDRDIYLDDGMQEAIGSIPSIISNAVMVIPFWKSESDFCMCLLLVVINDFDFLISDKTAK